MGEGQGAGGAGARAGRAGLGWAGLHRGSKSHGTHNQISESNREPKSETRRDEHAIKHDIRQKKYASA
jgi:hypothetical protein